MQSSPLPSSTTIRCYCAAVRLQVEAPPNSVVHCHCGQCRRLSGAAFTTWVSFPKTAVVLTGQEPLSVFKVTENVTRHFCRVCGSHVFTTDARLPRTLGVPAGALDGDFPLAPTAHYFVDHKAIWHHLCDELPRFGGNSGTQPTPARDSR